MAGTNNFLVFDQNNTNIETDTNYNNDTARLNGVGTGIASSLTHNKLYRQVSIMTAALAQFLANCNNNASDADINALITSITKTVASKNDLNTWALNKPVTDTGTANNYIISTGYSYSELFVGMIIKFTAVNANTGPSAINVDNLGYVSLVKGASTTLVAGDISTNQVITAIYDGTNFEIIPASPTSLPANGGNSATVNNHTASATPSTTEQTDLIKMNNEVLSDLISHEDNTTAHGATASATPNTIVMRDANGNTNLGGLSINNNRALTTADIGTNVESIFGYTAPNIGTMALNQYSLMASITLTAQYTESNINFAIKSSGNGNSNDTTGFLNWRVKQLGILGSAPIIGLGLFGNQNIHASNFIAVTTVNTSGQTTVNLYCQPWTAYDFLIWTPIIQNGTVSIYSNQPYISTLPTGAVTNCSQLAWNGDLNVNGNATVNGILTITNAGSSNPGSNTNGARLARWDRNPGSFNVQLGGNATTPPTFNILDNLWTKVLLSVTNAGVITTPNNTLDDGNGNLLIGGPEVSITHNGEARYHLYNCGDAVEWKFGQKSNTSNNFILSKFVSGTETDFMTIDTSGNMTVAGTITGSKVYNPALYDYAEYYQKQEGSDVEVGDVISLVDSDDGEFYAKSTKAYDPLVVGVYSGEYAQCIGGNGDGNDEENFIPIGEAGRVHVKVTGFINKGDLVTSSNIAGVAMKSDNYIPGTIIGKALESKTTLDIGLVRIKIMKL